MNAAGVCFVGNMFAGTTIIEGYFFISVDLKVDEISGKYQDVKRNC